MNKILNYLDGTDWLKEQDRLYPNRHNEIHKSCCKHCPSTKGSDPETDEIKNYPKDLILKEFAFVCAWRPNKLCKGFCDVCGIDQKFVSENT